MSNRKIFVLKPNGRSLSQKDLLLKRSTSQATLKNSFIENSSKISPLKGSILTPENSVKRMSMRRRIPSGSGINTSLSKNKSMVALSEKSRTNQSRPSLNISGINHSFTNSDKKPPSQRFKTFTKFNRDAMEIEEKLQVMLKKQKSNRSNSQYEIYKTIFEDLITRDTPFTNLLNRIKNAYEDRFSKSATATNRASQQLEKELRGYKAKHKRMLQQRDTHHERLKALATQNVQLTRVLDQKEEDLDNMEDGVMKIADYKKQNEQPSDVRAWGYISEENMSFNSLLSKMTYDLKAYKNKEKKIVKVICGLKDRGYNVGEVIEEVSSGRRPQPCPPDTPGGSETETEPIASGPPKNVLKPEAVPLLDIANIEPESDSTSQ